jgi:hypothetical protein
MVCGLVLCRRQNRITFSEDRASARRHDLGTASLFRQCSQNSLAVRDGLQACGAAIGMRSSRDLLGVGTEPALSRRGTGPPAIRCLGSWGFLGSWESRLFIFSNFLGLNRVGDFFCSTDLATAPDGGHKRRSRRVISM